MGKKSAMVRDRYSVIVGTGRYVPSRKILNQDFIGNEFYKGYEEAIDPTTNSIVLEKFKGITEISERRYVTDDQVASDIAVISAEEALRSSAIDRETLELTASYDLAPHADRHELVGDVVLVARRRKIGACRLEPWRDGFRNALHEAATG